MHLALERQEFFLVYQPRVDLKTNTMVGMEVLLRWQHPKRGVVFPDEFIAVAEHFNLIIPIGEWVLRTACRQYVDWKRDTLLSIVPWRLIFRFINFSTKVYFLCEAHFTGISNAIGLVRA